MTSQANFPEIIWWNREASWQKPSWQPQQHFMIFGTYEKQAKLPPQMAICLLLIRSSVCDSEINIFIGSWKLHLDLLWAYLLPASVDNHFFLFYMGLASGSWCWKSSSPNTRDCTLQGKVISSSSLLVSINFLLPHISTKVKDKLCSGKVTQILSWKTNFLALVLIGPLVLALSSLDPSFKYRNHQWFARGTSCCLSIKILCLSKYCESWIFHFLVWLWHHHISVEDWRLVLFGK